MDYRPLAAAAFCCVAMSPLPGLAQQAVQRHLVYNFSVGIRSDQHDTNASNRYAASANQTSAGAGPVEGSGDTSYVGLASDMGTIAVDVFGVEPDGGLVTKVSETARNNRNASLTECVVYPTTNVICGGEVNPEEMAVLKTMSPKFFDPGALDASRHWHSGNAAAGVSLDFTVGSVVANTVTIQETDNETKSGGNRVNGTATYTYDLAKTISTDLKEFDTVRQEAGPGKYTNVTVDITATLASDGVAKN